MARENQLWDELDAPLACGSGHREHEEVVVRAGLAADDRVCVSPLDTAVEGMKVRAVEESLAMGLTSTPEAAR